ncbi:hypothetical protein HPP92_007593 [Vanilla planifolia]|uniref:Uncharacterized protein n=1 Tax=Vanilla planifolia TaxID=51239 RepID=A0A835REC3_VANPL|nr:hypothetical protein HPP92_007593 [Vanilla planifolia]
MTIELRSQQAETTHPLLSAVLRRKTLPFAMSSSCRRRSDPAELDVFEATRYFSDGVEALGFVSWTSSEHPGRRQVITKPMDAVLKKSAPGPETAETEESSIEEEEEESCKQPISPCGRLACFLNSLFQQVQSKKQRKKAKPSKEACSSSSRTSAPPPVAEQKDAKLRDGFLKQGERLSKKGGSFGEIGFGERKWVLRRNGGGVFPRAAEEGGLGGKEKRLVWRVREEERSEDGMESDSSSDLFELKLFDLDGLSCGLPVCGKLSGVET